MLCQEGNEPSSSGGCREDDTVSTAGSPAGSVCIIRHITTGHVMAFRAGLGFWFPSGLLSTQRPR